MESRVILIAYVLTILLFNFRRPLLVWCWRFREWVFSRSSMRAVVLGEIHSGRAFPEWYSPISDGAEMAVSVLTRAVCTSSMCQRAFLSEVSVRTGRVLTGSCRTLAEMTAVCCQREATVRTGITGTPASATYRQQGTGTCTLLLLPMGDRWLSAYSRERCVQYQQHLSASIPLGGNGTYRTV